MELEGERTTTLLSCMYKTSLSAVLWWTWFWQLQLIKCDFLTRPCRRTIISRLNHRACRPVAPLILSPSLLFGDCV